MIAAALDTSRDVSLAIARGNRVLFSARAPASRRWNDMALVPWVRDGFASLEISPAEVGRWTVGTGPGSFSGTRVGIALVRGICAVSGAALRGVPGSVAMARTACGEGASDDGIVGVLHDARREELILTRYRVSGGRPYLLGEAAVVAPEALLETPCRCNRWVGLRDSIDPEALPVDLRPRLRLVDGVNAELLLHIPGWGWPRTPAAVERSVEPVYVRPAVFVEPRLPRPPATRAP
ncbi:MAG: tRNA (adenosine(37)-N6)-threonylcarbamoyltransferase complex dimerization subunit type 1 TsaB [Lentisphaeria bacterium]|nr:tRNA (adenosine(37)-N6)-threonylcarbamoyltransferase complex dimerization subunit type 1 TsaB [Lentisphaeria bacterium]